MSFFTDELIRVFLRQPVIYYAAGTNTPVTSYSISGEFRFADERGIYLGKFFIPSEMVGFIERLEQ